MSLRYGRLLTRPDSICLSLVSLIILSESTKSVIWHIGTMDLKDSCLDSTTLSRHYIAGQYFGVSTSLLNFSGSFLNRIVTILSIPTTQATHVFLDGYVTQKVLNNFC